MKEELKKLLLSESLEDNWLAVEILRTSDRPDHIIGGEILDFYKEDMYFRKCGYKYINRLFKSISNGGYEGEYLHFRNQYILRRDINDYTRH